MINQNTAIKSNSLIAKILAKLDLTSSLLAITSSNCTSKIYHMHSEHVYDFQYKNTK